MSCHEFLGVLNQSTSQTEVFFVTPIVYQRALADNGNNNNNDNDNDNDRNQHMAGPKLEKASGQKEGY
jgi:hypothetical protein